MLQIKQYGNMTNPDRNIEQINPGSECSNGTEDSDGNEVGLGIRGKETDEMKATAAIIALIDNDDNIGIDNGDNCIENINSISDKNSDHYIKIKSENGNSSISIKIESKDDKQKKKKI